MNLKIVEGWVSEVPEKPADRYIFLTDRLDRAEAIFTAGFRSVMLAEDQSGFFSLAALADFLKRPETLTSQFRLVLCMSSKRANDETRKALSGAETVDGWRIFFHRDYLSQPGYTGDLQKALNDFVNQFEGPGPVSLVSLADVEEEEPAWLIPGYLPRGQICLLGGDGGTSKTSIWCNIVASVTTGRKSIFHEVVPFDQDIETGTVMFFASEDPVKTILKKRLRVAGADPSMVLFVDQADPGFSKIRFNSDELRALIKKYRPVLCIFDPLQAFVPSDVNMASRNQMRQCMAPLSVLGATYGTTFLIVMHTNKKANVSGRARFADSADVVDIARSALITGKSGEKDVFYVSHEKSNYGRRYPTILFRNNEGKVEFFATTDKEDADFVREATATRPAPSRDQARETILAILADGKEHPVAEVDAAAKAAGVSTATAKRAKTELKNDGLIRFVPSGFGQTKTWLIKRVSEMGA